MTTHGRITPSAAAALAALLLGMAGVLPAQAAGFGRLILQKDSLYHRIFVYQDGSLMTLQFGRMRTDVVQSQVDLSNLRRNMHEYTTLSFCGLLYKSDPKTMLVVGLGGGVIPREMHHYFPDMKIDVAEIDPDIPPIAEKYFAFKTDDKLKVTVDDGRMFIRKALRKDPVPKYDYIILDAFTADYIPFHLMTKEFLEEVKGVLSDDGVVVANIFYNSNLADAELKTYLAAFGRCQVYMGAYSGNAMLVSPGKSAPVLTAQEAIERARALRLPPDFSFDMTAVAARLRPEVVPIPEAIVLTDDRAPVNYLRTQKPEDIATGPADTLELLNGQSYQGKLVDRGDEQVSFRVISGGTTALMVWPTRVVKAITVDGIRHVINETAQSAVQ
jgi:spermidine synthase